MRSCSIFDKTVDTAVTAGTLSWCQGGILFLGRDHTAHDSRCVFWYRAPLPVTENSVKITAEARVTLGSMDRCGLSLCSVLRRC